MDESTTVIEKSTIEKSSGKTPSHESHMFSMSTRSLITLIVVLTVCLMSYRGMKVEEPLYTLVGMCIGYYFGQNGKPKSQTP